MERGAVWLAELPGPAESEPGYRRPYVIIASNAFNQITDESRLSDFTDFGAGDVAPIIKEIMKVYGIDVSDVSCGNLLELFRNIDLDQRSRRSPSAPKGRSSDPFSRKDFENILGEMRRQARRAGLKRNYIAAAIRAVRKGN